MSFNEPSGLIALANALQQHTALQEFKWFDGVLGGRQHRGPFRRYFTPGFASVSPPSSSYHRDQARSADALKNHYSCGRLHLSLKTTDHWSAVTDEIRQGRCNVEG
jgi:hypothetical protein